MSKQKIIDVFINGARYEIKGTLTLSEPQPVLRTVVYYADGDSEEGSMSLDDLRRALTPEAFEEVREMFEKDPNHTVASIYVNKNKGA